jgi:RING finger and CHY zinc finger domain-containing protein 1
MSAPGGRRVHRSASLPSSYVSLDPDDTHHNIDRFAIAEVICRMCFTRQSSKTNSCVRCSTTFAEYHCSICNLWMQNDERPYHCADCGFCRIGGAENFLHCNSCGMCIDKNLINTHNCRAGKYRSNCPVCQEYLFSSRGASHEMPCGHAIHWECFRQLASHDSRCPICKKTAETHDRMMPTWEAMSLSIDLQPIPPDLARVVTITCNDCEKSEDARAWHFLGVQCSHCKSFNTVVDKIVLTGEEAHEFLETNARMAAIQQQRLRMEANGGNADPNNTGDGDDPDRPRRRRFNRRRSAF